MPVLAAVSVAGTLYSGISSMTAANREARMQQAQGEQAMAEAKANATNEAINQTHAVGEQKLAFLANGVSLEGSPSAVIQASTAYGQQQVNSILKQGASRYALAQQEAANTKAAGRAALIASISQAGSSAYKTGIFDTAPKTPTSGTTGGSMTDSIINARGY